MTIECGFDCNFFVDDGGYYDDFCCKARQETRKGITPVWCPRLKDKKDIKIIDYIYLLEAEDNTNAGGPMHHQETSTLFIKPFKTLKGAKNFAIQSGGDFNFSKWKKNGNMWYIDARWVEYTITKILVED